MMETLLILVAVIALAGLVLQAFSLSAQKRAQAAQVDSLTERVARVSAESREALTERLGKHFLEAQERVDRALGANRGELQAGLGRSTQALEARFTTLEKQVSTRLDAIGKSVETKLNENLKEGFRQFEKVQTSLAAAELKLAQLGVVGQSIQDLNSLLKLPHLRGSFGEATLERLLQDFLPQGSYELQYRVVPGAPEAVDAIVRFATQMLPIDSKFPREQVLPLFESSDPAAMESARRMLNTVIRAQAKSIADKYIRPDHGTMDMALLFLPSETLYFEVTRNGELFEYLSKLNVFPASPNTLAIALRSVAVAQEYYNMAKGVEQTIEDVKKARKHFESFEQRFGDVGAGLKKATDAFEKAQTHLGRYEGSITRLTGGEAAGSGLEDMRSSAGGTPELPL